MNLLPRLTVSVRVGQRGNRNIFVHCRLAVLTLQALEAIASRILRRV